MQARDVVLFSSLLFCGALTAQGVWEAPFDHKPDGALVHPSSDSLPGAHPQRWITTNAVAPATPGQKFQAIHACLIPSGPHRGEVLVWDGNLTLYGVRAYQPWAIVNPYPPGANPFVAGGGSLYRFHNATLSMPAGAGELFCGGQRWGADGRLFYAGGTRAYPPAFPPSTVIPTGNTGIANAWEGAKLVYQWDPTPTASDPFGTWYQMPDLAAERWYPTVLFDGTSADRALILAGSDLVGSTFGIVNTYESFRVDFNAPTPNILLVEQKTGGLNPKQYVGTTVPSLSGSAQEPGFTEYPRAVALGVLDPIIGGFAPRLFVSGYWGQGIRWAHDPTTDPTYALDAGQETVRSSLVYGTSLLYPNGIGAMPEVVTRIGGYREIFHVPPMPTNRVETASVVSLPSTWSSGTPNDIPDMLHPRTLANVVMLPNRELFAIGGFDGANFVFEPEVLRNGAVWKPLAPHSSPRQYHSCALLLPDGRIFVCGGEFRTSDYEIFEPDYLQLPASHRPSHVQVFDDQTLLPISETSLQGVTYGGTYRAGWSNRLPTGIQVEQAVLVAPAALTHHDDGGQRCIRLVATHNSAPAPTPYGTLLFKMPPSEEYAPPGWYMLFLVTNEGVPANAYWVNLR